MTVEETYKILKDKMFKYTASSIWYLPKENFIKEKGLQWQDLPKGKYYINGNDSTHVTITRELDGKVYMIKHEKFDMYFISELKYKLNILLK